MASDIHSSQDYHGCRAVPGATEIVFALGAGDSFVGVTHEVASTFPHVCLPAEAETRTEIVFPRSGRILIREPGDLLWPAREGGAELETQKQMLGSAA